MQPMALRKNQKAEIEYRISALTSMGKRPTHMRLKTGPSHLLECQSREQSRPKRNRQSTSKRSLQREKRKTDLIRPAFFLLLLGMKEA